MVMAPHLGQVLAVKCLVGGVDRWTVHPPLSLFSRVWVSLCPICTTLEGVFDTLANKGGVDRSTLSTPLTLAC